MTRFRFAETKGGYMNGYKKILYESERELIKCQNQMNVAKSEMNSVDFAQWTRRALEAEAVIAFIKQKLED